MLSEDWSTNRIVLFGDRLPDEDIQFWIPKSCRNMHFVWWLCIIHTMESHLFPLFGVFSCSLLKETGPEESPRGPSFLRFSDSLLSRCTIALLSLSYHSRIKLLRRYICIPDKYLSKGQNTQYCTLNCWRKCWQPAILSPRVTHIIERFRWRGKTIWKWITLWFLCFENWLQEELKMPVKISGSLRWSGFP